MYNGGNPDAFATQRRAFITISKSSAFYPPHSSSPLPCSLAARFHSNSSASSVKALTHLAISSFIPSPYHQENTLTPDNFNALCGLSVAK